MEYKSKATKIICPNSMNREDLSKLSKDQLINMLLGKQTVSANKAGPVKLTASAKAGPVFQPKSLTQLAANMTPKHGKYLMISILEYYNGVQLTQHLIIWCH